MTSNIAGNRAAASPKGAEPGPRSARLPSGDAPAPRGFAADSTRRASSGGIIEDVGRLAEIHDAWESLGEASGPPMQQLAWTHAALAAFGRGHEPSVVVAGAPPCVTAIAPLFRRPGAADRMEFLSAGEIYEPMDFLYSDGPALARLADTIRRSGRAVFLRRIREDSPTIGALRRSFRGRGIVVCRRVAAYPWIPLDAGWARPEERIEPRRRADLRRAWRLARRGGEVRSEVLSPTPASLGPLLEEAFRVEAAGWKGRSGTAVARDDRRAPFYRLFAEAACRKGILRVCFLRVGGKAAAMQLAVESGGSFWLLKIGYDEAFRRCSPGTLLTHDTIRHAAERGLTGYEFLGVVEPWTTTWTREIRSCVSVRAYPAGRRGLVALAADLAGYASRRLGTRPRGGRGRDAA